MLTVIIFIVFVLGCLSGYTIKKIMDEKTTMNGTFEIHSDGVEEYVGVHFLDDPAKIKQCKKLYLIRNLK